MTRLRVALACLALGTVGVVPGAAQQSGPYVHICLEDYSSNAGQARFRAKVDWNGLPAGQYARVDLVARDASGDYWPQFHDSRLQPGADSSLEPFGVSDVTRYPITMYVVGLTQQAADAYDADCARNFCSLRMSAPGVTRLGSGDEVVKPTDDTPHCEH